MTTIQTEPKKRHRLTQGDCDAARLLMERKQTLQEIGKIIGVDSSTVGKIRLAGYDLQTYLAQRRAMNKKTKENKKALKFAHVIDKVLEEQGVTKLCDEIDEREKKLQQLGRAAAGGIAKATEQVAGQLQMELESQFTPEALKAYKEIGAITERNEKRTEPDGPCARSNTVIPREHTLAEFEKKLDERRFQAALMDKLLKKLDKLIDVLQKGGGSHE